MDQGIKSGVFLKTSSGTTREGIITEFLYSSQIFHVVVTLMQETAVHCNFNRSRPVASGMRKIRMVQHARLSCDVIMLTSY